MVILFLNLTENYQAASGKYVLLGLCSEFL